MIVRSLKFILPLRLILKNSSEQRACIGEIMR